MQIKWGLALQVEDTLIATRSSCTSQQVSYRIVTVYIYKAVADLLLAVYLYHQFAMRY
jgi:hypothetical protein